MSVRIAEELDYRLEAANQARVRRVYRGHPFIHVPEVVGELCTARVLTQELVQGKSWSDALTAGQELRDQWAEAIWRFVYGTYKRLCLFNADPHPGNYIFHDDGSVSFLDFGCVKRFSREQVEMIERDRARMPAHDVLGTWRASVEAGFWRSSDPVTPEEVFAYWREGFGNVWAEQPFIVTPEYVARWIERRCSPERPLGQRLPAHHRIARVHDHEPGRDRGGVVDRAAARRQLLGLDSSRALRERRTAYRDGQARARVLRRA